MRIDITHPAEYPRPRGCLLGLLQGRAPSFWPDRLNLYASVRREGWWTGSYVEFTSAGLSVHVAGETSALLPYSQLSAWRLDHFGGRLNERFPHDAFDGTQLTFTRNGEHFAYCLRLSTWQMRRLARLWLAAGVAPVYRYNHQLRPLAWAAARRGWWS